MCGPTTQEKSEAAAQQQYSERVQNNYNTLFGEQQGQVEALNNVFTPIAEAGPNQTGFSAPELAAYNTQAINTTGANYANAAKALGTQLAGRGGSSGLESGVDQQIKAGLAANAAGTLSNEELGITEANYAQGRQNFAQAAGGLQALAGIENPTGAAGAGTNANSAAFSEANTIEEQQAQKAKTIGGLIEGGVGALAGGFGNLDTTGGSSAGEQAQNFLTGAFSA